MQYAVKIFTLYILSIILCWKIASANRTSFLVDEVRSLRELPLDELIHIKCTLGVEKGIIEEDEQKEEMSSRALPVLLPLAQPLKRGNGKPIRRYEEHYEEKGKDTKISKIFQLSITALSFLAFGGYLLTLIITAIRQNSGMNGTGNVIVLSNLQGLQNYNRPRRDILVLDPRENDFEIEKLYRGMILLSKSYASYS